MSRRTSIIWKISRKELIEIVNSSNSVTEALSHFSFENKGNNYKTLKARMGEEGLDYNDLATRGKTLAMQKIHELPRKSRLPLEKILIENSTVNRTHIKSRLINEQILENKCSICEQEPVWFSKKLTMVLDHINGVSNDYRAKNLRLLCPNCNSQTKTFAGRNIKNKDTTIYTGVDQLVGHLTLTETVAGSSPVSGKNKVSISKCRICKKKFIITHTTHRYCSRKCSGEGSRRVERPDKETLRILVWEKPTSALAKELGVSGKAIEKWCKSYNIDKPPRGYWAKKRKK